MTTSWCRKDTHELSECEQACAGSGGDIKPCAGSLGVGNKAPGKAGLPTGATTQPLYRELTKLRSPEKSNHYCPAYLGLPV